LDTLLSTIPILNFRFDIFRLSLLSFWFLKSILFISSYQQFISKVLALREFSLQVLFIPFLDLM
jgi:hypothetical protein